MPLIMTNQLINIKTGEFTIAPDFIASRTTTLNDLMNHFGKDKLTESEYVKGYYSLPKLKMENLYFRFTFHFKNELLKEICFEIDETSEPRAPYASNQDLETNWIARQTNDTAKFDWNNNPNQEQYGLQYDWGGVGVFFDFKNGTYQSSLNYKSN
jgi:hypothetical protein